MSVMLLFKAKQRTFLTNMFFQQKIRLFIDNDSLMIKKNGRK